jgi:hypothetical protein
VRKIIVGAQVSVDGVMQAPGGPTEDPTRGFKFGGWVMPYFDQEFGEELDKTSPWRHREALQGDQEVRGVALGRGRYELVDAMSIFTVPVVLGSGKKLFADGSAPHAYKLTGRA